MRTDSRSNRRRPRAGGVIAQAGTPPEVSPPVSPAPMVTVVVPTRNEAGNIAELLRRLDRGLAEMPAEIVFVDDSDDGTPAEVLRCANVGRWPVQLLHRSPGARDGGLGGAVVAGLRAAAAPWAVVLDGDLQHPPEVVSQLVREGTASGAALVVATRYAGAGDAAGLAGGTRATVSAACTWLARIAFPRRLRRVTDPMSGFFAVRLDAVDLTRLRPRGYKILLEILARTRVGSTREVPFSFQPRFSGESKASVREGLTFARQLVALRLAAWRSIGGGQPVVTSAVESSLTLTTGRHAAASTRMSTRARVARFVRLALPPVLALVAFPNLAELVLHPRAANALTVGALGCLAGAAVTAIGRLQPRSGEPDVHDRQLDVILALPLVAVAAWLAVGWQWRVGLHDGLSDHEVVGAVAFLGAACLLILGTRVTARIRGPLLLGLAAAPSVSVHQLVPALVLVVVLVDSARRLHGRIGAGRGTGEPRSSLAERRRRRRGSQRWPDARVAVALLAVFAGCLGLRMARLDRPLVDLVARPAAAAAVDGLATSPALPHLTWQAGRSS